MELVTAIFLAYISGAIPFGKIFASSYGVDIRKIGSGNIGAANVFRNIGWKIGLVVLIADALKGYLPVIFAGSILGVENNLLFIVGLSAILGHLHSVWINFRGGKGVATGLGVVLAMSPFLGILGFLVYCLSLAIYRRSAPSSLTAACSLPILGYVFAQELIPFLILLPIIAFWTHRKNITHIINGKQANDSLS